MAGLAPEDVLRVQSEKVFVENITFAAERLAEVKNNNHFFSYFYYQGNFRKESLAFSNQSMVTPCLAISCSLMSKVRNGILTFF